MVFTPITSAINLMRYFHYSKILKAILWFNLLSGVEPLACQNGGARKMRVSNKMKVNIGRKGGHSCRCVRFGTNHVVFTPITSAINLMRYFHYSKILKAILWFNLLSGVEPLACQNGGARKMRVSNKMKVNIGRKGGHSCRFSESHSCQTPLRLENANSTSVGWSRS